MKYVIDSKVYENHINDEVHLYGLLHQLAFLAEKAKDEKDLENLAETAKRYGEIAEEKFAAWRIPGRYLVFGDRKDLAELKAAELTPLTAVLKEHDAKAREKQRAATADDPAYIISGSAFRMLAGDLFDLLAQYGFLRNRVLEVKTERQLARLQKNLSGENPRIRRMYRRWGLAEDQGVTCYDILEATLRRRHLTPYDPEEAAEDGIGCGPVGCLGKMLLASSIWASTKRSLTWQKRDTLFSHSYFRLAASAHGMSASELLSSRLMFPTPLASDKSTCRDAANLDVFLSDNGIFRKRNKDGTIWSLSLSAAVFYLTPAASEGYRSTLKPTAFWGKSPSSNLSAQVIHQEQPLSEKAALNPDWVEWLMGFPQGWTDVSSGPPSRRTSPA